MPPTPPHHPPTGHRPRVTRAPPHPRPQHTAATRAHRGTQCPGRHRHMAHLKPTRSPKPGQPHPTCPSAQPTGGCRMADPPATKTLSTPSWSPAGPPPETDPAATAPRSHTEPRGDHTGGKPLTVSHQARLQRDYAAPGARTGDTTATNDWHATACEAAGQTRDKSPRHSAQGSGTRVFTGINTASKPADQQQRATPAWGRGESGLCARKAMPAAPAPARNRRQLKGRA